MGVVRSRVISTPHGVVSTVYREGLISFESAYPARPAVPGFVGRTSLRAAAVHPRLGIQPCGTTSWGRHQFASISIININSIMIMLMTIIIIMIVAFCFFKHGAPDMQATQPAYLRNQGIWGGGGGGGSLAVFLLHVSKACSA